MTKTNLLCLLAFLFLLGCGQNNMGRIEYRHHCTTSVEKACMGNHALQCIEAGNPLSDEEPEDWLPKCRDIAAETCCPYVKGAYIWTSSSGSGFWVPWEEVPENVKKRLKGADRLAD